MLALQRMVPLRMRTSARHGALHMRLMSSTAAAMRNLIWRLIVYSVYLSVKIPVVVVACTLHTAGKIIGWNAGPPHSSSSQVNASSWTHLSSDSHSTSTSIFPRPSATISSLLITRRRRLRARLWSVNSYFCVRQSTVTSRGQSSVEAAQSQTSPFSGLHVTRR